MFRFIKELVDPVAKIVNEAERSVKQKAIIEQEIKARMAKMEATFNQMLESRVQEELINLVGIDEYNRLIKERAERKAAEETENNRKKNEAIKAFAKVITEIRCQMEAEEERKPKKIRVESQQELINDSLEMLKETMLKRGMKAKEDNGWKGMGRSFSDEENYLAKTRTAIRINIDSIKSKLSYNNRRDNGLGGADAYTDYILGKRMASKVPQLEEMHRSPYFGRVDFETINKEPNTFYIGKNGFEDLVVSWTSSIGSLFYQRKLGKASSTYGEIQVQLIRQFERDFSFHDLEYKGENFNNEYFDPILDLRLKASSNEKMKDIVDTIQAEQDIIIRLPKNKPVIVQGSAGSGKTTVALHRLAYLFFEEKNMDPEKLLIIGPNKMFLKYISHVLPDLGVDGVAQSTFQEWAVDQLTLHNYKITEPSETMRIIEKNKSQITDLFKLKSRIKNSLEFRNIIDDYLKDYEKNIIFKNSVNIIVDQDHSFEITNTELRKWFDVDYKYLPLNKRKQVIVQRIERNLREFLIKREFPLNKDIKAQLASIKKEWAEETEVDIYHGLMTNHENIKYFAHENIGQDTFLFLCRYHTFLTENREIEFDDLSPLLYIRKFLTGEIGCKQKSGNDIKYTNYHYVIIDEGQDFSPFQIEIIRSVTNPGSIMILGDLGQSIFDFRAVNKWDQISNLLHDPSYVELMTCYRSTEQITKFANKIIEPWSRGRYNLSLPLLRSGKEPNVLKKSEADWLGEIHNILTNDVTKQYRNIALITRSDEETIELKQKLNISDAEVMVNPDDEYMGGLVMIPAYLSKGIEFDVVIVVDVSKDRYDNNDSDRKLMYVACTRALHELYLISKGEVSPILKEMLN